MSKRENTPFDGSEEEVLDFGTQAILDHDHLLAATWNCAQRKGLEAATEKGKTAGLEAYMAYGGDEAQAQGLELLEEHRDIIEAQARREMEADLASRTPQQQLPPME